MLATVERLVDFVHQRGHFFGALGGRGNQDPLGAAFVVLGSVSECGEEPGGLDDVIAAMVTPRKVHRITFADASGFLSVDREAVGMGFDVAFEHTVGGVVLQQIRQVVEGTKSLTSATSNRRGGWLDVEQDGQCGQNVDTNTSGHGWTWVG